MNDKTIQFAAKLNWLQGKSGRLSADDAEGTIEVAAPPQFGGEGNPWTPEHLFLGAISSCFMTTYLSFAGKMKFEIAGLNCKATGHIKIVEGGYRFTEIQLYPEIYIKDESLREKAEKAIEKTHQYCLVARSINADVIYHSQVLTDRTERQLIS